MTTLEQVILDRTDAGMADLLLEIYACAYCAGANIACEVDHSESMRQLIYLLADRHQREVLALRDPPMLADELPSWLLRLKQQADTTPAGWGEAEGWPI